MDARCVPQADPVTVRTTEFDTPGSREMFVP
jgi:hypothetical protein